MKSRPGSGAYAVVSAVSPPVSLVVRRVFSGAVEGREHVPPSGPYIVTANHLSLIDPVLVTMAVGRLIRFLALDELFGEHEVLDRLMLYFGSVSLSRDRPPLGAIKQALEILEEDDVVGIFPEGARAEYWGERTIKRGAAWLSIATGAPVVPCSISGSEGTLSLIEPGIHAPAVRLSIHPPIYPDSYIEREDPLGSMMDDWAAAIGDRIGHWKREE